MADNSNNNNSNNNNNNKNNEEEKGVGGIAKLNIFIEKLFSIKPASKLLDIITSLVSNKKCTTFAQLQQSYQDSMSRSICGKVWKSNAHIYKCLDCQIDENCAICIDCFEEDKHEGHRYRLIPSNSGCCDCGDLSAWKKEGCCSVHVKKQQSDQTFKRELPENVKEIILDTLMVRLIMDISSVNHTSITDSILDVLNKFIEVLGDDFTLLLANEISEAPTTVYKGLAQLAGKNSQTLEKFIISLFISSEFRDNLALAMAESFDDPLYDSNLTVQLFTVEQTSLKIVSTYKFKHIVNSFIKHIKKSQDENDSDEDDEEDDSSDEEEEHGAARMKTTKSSSNSNSSGNGSSDKVLYQRLNTKSNGLVKKTYFKSLISIAYIIKTKSSFQWLIEHQELLFKCLDSIAIAQGMNPNIRLTTRHIEYDDISWIHCFYLEIYLSRYISRAIFDQFTTNSTMITKECSKQFKLYLLNHLIQYFNNENTTTGIGSSTSNNVGNKWKKGIREITIPEYRVSKQPVSLHLPLHRSLMSLLYFESINFEKTPSQVLGSMVRSEEELQVLCSVLGEHIFRAFALSHQYYAGMWVRNGDSLRNQMRNYYRAKDQNCSLDIYLIQYLSLAMNSKLFYCQFLDRVELASWFFLDGQIFNNHDHHGENGGGDSIVTSKLTSSSSSTGSIGSNVHLNHHKSESDRANTIIAENFLESIVWIVTDRTKIAKLEESNQQLRKELIHILSVKPQPFGDIYPLVSECFEDSMELDTILKDISTFVNSKVGTESGIYQLKPSVWKEWNYYYPYHTKDEQQKSEENFIQNCRREKITGGITARPIAPLEEPLKEFNGIESLLHCEILHSILFSVVYNSLTGSVKTSDSLLSTAIHLLYLSIDSFELNRLNKLNNPEIVYGSESQDLLSTISTKIIDIPTTTSAQSSFSSALSISPRKIASSFVEFMSPKQTTTTAASTTSQRHDFLDLGFTSDNILKNFIQPIKQSNSFIPSVSPSTITLHSLLKLMQSLPKFESHHSSINQLLNHPILVNGLKDDNSSGTGTGSGNDGSIPISSSTNTTSTTTNTLSSSTSSIKSSNEGFNILKESTSPTNDSHLSQMKEQAMKRQMELMRLMKEQQKNFIKLNEMDDDDDDDYEDEENDKDHKMGNQEDGDEEEEEQDNVFNFESQTGEDEMSVDQLNTSTTSTSTTVEESIDFGSCAICRDTFSALKQSRPFGYVGSLQKNSLLSYCSLLVVDPLVSSETKRRESMDKSRLDDPLIVDVNNTNGAFITFCSHLIHVDCLNSILDNSNQNSTAQLVIRPPNRAQEYLCPCCRRSSNCIVPYSKQKITSIKSNLSLKSTQFNNWLNSIYQSSIKDIGTTTNTTTTATSNLDNNDPFDALIPVLSSSTSTTIAFDQFVNFIYENTTNQNSGIDKIHNLWNLIGSGIGVYELSKRKSKLIDANTFNLTRQSIQNLLKKTVEQSILDNEKRQMDLKSLIAIIFNNSNNNGNNSGSSFIKLDMFGLLIRFYFSNESLKSNKPPLLYIVSLFFIGTFIQSILYVYKFKNLNSMFEFLNQIDHTNFTNLDEQVLNICIPFLRKVCFLSCCIDTNLKIVGSSDGDSVGEGVGEFQILIKFLIESSGIKDDSFFEKLVFKNEVINQLILNVWFNSSKDSEFYYRELPLRSYGQLDIIKLPLDYHKFFLECTGKKKCSKCNGENGVVKFICLLCGDLLCLKDYFNHSNFTRSTNNNGNNDSEIHPIGLYLIFSETYIIININQKSKLWGTVYLDSHYSEDLGLKRGKPLSLNQDRLDKLKDDILTLHNVHSLQTVFVNTGLRLPQ